MTFVLNDPETFTVDRLNQVARQPLRIQLRYLDCLRVHSMRRQ
jgi:hypothetical protein